MKKITLMFFAFLMTTIGYAQSFSGTAGAIDDNNCGTATNDFTATVTGIGTLGGTNSLESVTLNITHTWNSDLEVTLIDPTGGTSLLLVDGVGGSGDGFTDCIIIDGGAALPTVATTPVTGSFAPTGPGNMADFNMAGVAADGDWTLSVCDSAGGDIGMVDSWSITFVPTPMCPSVSGIVSTPTSTTDTTITWSAGGSEMDWNYEWGVTTFTPGAGTAGSVMTTPSLDISGLTPGEIYDIYVEAICGPGDTSGFVGPITWTQPLPPPANDDCANATNIVPSATAAPVYITGTTSSNTASGEVTDADLSCISAGAFGSGRDVWFQVEVPASGEINIETQASAGSPLTDTILTVFSGTCGALAGTELGCNDDGGAGFFSLVALTAQTPGAILLVRVQEYAPSASRGPQDGDFEVTAYAADPALGLEDVTFNNFKYFPNPVNRTLSLRAQDNIQAVSVYNMLGQEVLRTAPNGLQDELDMSGLNTGAYFLKVRINDVEENFRIIKE